MSGKLHYIHLEGMDLAGKTTACAGLVRALGGQRQVRHNSLCEDNPVYRLADQIRRADGLTAGPLGHLYVAALAVDLEEYKPPAQPTIQDSTILLRSLAYHTVRNTPHVPEALTAMLPIHPRFGVSVVLTARLDIRLERLETRRRHRPDEVAADDLLVYRDPARFLAMERVLIEVARKHFGAVVLDTSSLTDEDVVREILDAAA